MMVNETNFKVGSHVIIKTNEGGSGEGRRIISTELRQWDHFVIQSHPADFSVCIHSAASSSQKQNQTDLCSNPSSATYKPYNLR